MKESDLKNNILETMKNAMRLQEKERLGTIRMIQAAIKQWEVDERIVLTNEQILSVLDKMIRQRREAIKQFEAANRTDLVEKESREIEIIQEFLPTPLTSDELQTLVKQAIDEVGAQSVRDMSKVMAVIKPKIQGRADMGTVGSLIKHLLPQ